MADRASLSENAQNTLEVAAAMAEQYRKDISLGIAHGHDRMDVLAALANEVYDDHDDMPWEMDSLLGVWIATTFLLAEANSEIDRLRDLLKGGIDGNRRSGRGD